MSDIDEEIERLQMKKVEIIHKLNLTEYIDEKEDYMNALETIQRQIDILERLKTS